RTPFVPHSCSSPLGLLVGVPSTPSVPHSCSSPLRGGADFDRDVVRQQMCEVDSGVHVRHIDDVETAQLLDRLGVRSFGDRPLGPRLQRARRRWVGQPLAGDHLTPFPHGGGERRQAGEEPLALLRSGAIPLRVVVRLDELDHELHGAVPSSWSTAARTSTALSAPTSTRQISRRSSRSSDSTRYSPPSCSTVSAYGPS